MYFLHVKQGFGIPWVLLVLGIGLTINCMIALLRREDVYDRSSYNRMLLANTAGMLIGAGLICLASRWLLLIYNHIYS